MATPIQRYTRRGASATPPLNDAFGARFDQSAASWPDREAIVVS